MVQSLHQSALRYIILPIFFSLVWNFWQVLLSNSHISTLTKMLRGNCNGESFSARETIFYQFRTWSANTDITWHINFLFFSFSVKLLKSFGQKKTIVKFSWPLALFWTARAPLSWAILFPLAKNAIQMFFFFSEKLRLHSLYDYIFLISLSNLELYLTKGFLFNTICNRL